MPELKSPYILCIETSTEICSVAVLYGKKVASLQESHLRYRHGGWLTIAIQQALESAEIERKDLNAVSVTKGPGSYTGLRVGLATAKAICMGLDIPLLAHSSLQVLAYGMRSIAGNKNYLMPMMDARRMEVYSAIFDNECNRITDDEPLILDEDSCADIIDQYEAITIGGDGAEKSLDLWNSDRLHFAVENISAAYQRIPAERAYREKNFQDLAYLRPTYLKKPNITKPSKTL